VNEDFRRTRVFVSEQEIQLRGFSVSEGKNESEWEQILIEREAENCLGF
jgi:hypothetical protein